MGDGGGGGTPSPRGRRGGAWMLEIKKALDVSKTFVSFLQKREKNIKREEEKHTQRTPPLPA